MFKMSVFTLFILGFIASNLLGSNSLSAYALENLAPIYISEVNYSGSTNPAGCRALDSGSKTTCANDKWIEIHNTSDKSFDIKGFTVGVGKKTADPATFASTFSINSSVVIPASGYMVLLNKDSGLESTLKSAKIEYSSLGSMFGISNNSSGKKYIRVALLNTGKIVSEVNITDLDSLEKQNNITQSESKKYSINLDEKGQPTFSQTEYFQNNYGSPGLPFVLQKPTEKETNQKIETVKKIESVLPVQQALPVPIPINISAELAKSTLPVNIPETINVVKSVEVKSAVNIIPAESLHTEKSSSIVNINNIKAVEQVLGTSAKHQKMIEVAPVLDKNLQALVASEVEQAKPEKPRSEIHIISTSENATLQFSPIQEIPGLNSVPNLGLFNLISLLSIACKILFSKFKKGETTFTRGFAH